MPLHCGTFAAILQSTQTDLSPVTLADRNAEAAMRDLLAQESLSTGSSGRSAGRRDATGVRLDQSIDGTKSHHRQPLFSTLVAGTQGTARLGVIDFRPWGALDWCRARTLHQDARGQEREIRVPCLHQSRTQCFAVHHPACLPQSRMLPLSGGWRDRAV